MADTVILQPAPAKRRWRLKRILVLAVGIVGVLLVAAYFVATSSAFFKAVVLPRIGESINAQVSVADAVISPFSMIVLRDLKIQPRDAEQILSAQEVHLRYNLWDIIGGKIKIDDLALTSPTVSIVENSDGRSNLDAIIEALGKRAEIATPQLSKPAKPIVVDLKTAELNNVTVRWLKHFKDGGSELIELANANLTLGNLGNGQLGSLKLSGGIKLDIAPVPPATNAALQARFDGEFRFDLSQGLHLASLKGTAALVIKQAGGALTDFGVSDATLDCDVTPAEIRQLTIKFGKDGTELGRVQLNGPFDLAKLQGKLQVEILNIGRQVLNIAGSVIGLDFGQSVFNSSNQIEITGGGKVVTVTGQTAGASVTVSQKGLSTPTLDLQVAYDITVDQTQQAASVRTFSLAATRNGQPLLQGKLAKPTQLAWTKGANAVEESAFNLTLTDLNLAEWRAFLGSNINSGQISAQLDVFSQQAGRKLQFSIESGGRDLSVEFGSNKFDRAEFSLKLLGNLDEFRVLQLAGAELKLTQRSKPLVSGSVNGRFDLTTQDANIAVAMSAQLPSLAGLIAVPDFEAASGSMSFTGRVAQSNSASASAKSVAGTRKAEGKVLLSGFSGRYREYRFEQLDVALGCDMELSGQQVQIRKLNGVLKQAGQPAGAFDMRGNFHMAERSAELAVNLADLNQNALRLFLAPMLGDKKLVTATINASLNGRYNAKVNSVLDASLQITNLVINDPKGKMPTTPFDVRLKLDTIFGKQAAEIRECRISLIPTGGVPNELYVKGRANFSQTNAIQGEVKLAAELVDATWYYDLFTGKPGVNKDTSAVAKNEGSAGTDAGEEPAAVKLPLRDFAVEANIGRLLLRDLEVTNIQARAKFDGSSITVRPIQLVLNGAPITGHADVDLGIPGFKYNVSLTADAVPLVPLVNSFVPERKGQLGGNATAKLEIMGAGVTGTNLWRNLSGEFNLAATNLNLSISHVSSPLLNTVINVVVSLPNLIRNPTAAVGSMLSRLTNLTGKQSGWAEKLTSAPIEAVEVAGKLGRGDIEFQKALVRSSAFLAETAGHIKLSPVLTNSTLDFPVAMSLSSELASELNIVSTSQLADKRYAKLPDFLTVRGTLGEPETKIDKTALAKMAIKTFTPSLFDKSGDTPSSGSSKSKNILGNLLDNLTGSANPVATNTVPPLNPFDFFKKKP